MTVKKLNMEDVKINNRGSLLRLLYNNQPMSRIEISENLKLTTASVSMICSDFLSQNLIVQSNDESADEHKVGRKVNPISINYNYKYILSINIHFNECTLSVINLKGDKINSVSIPTIYDSDEKILLDALIQAGIKLIWSCSLTPPEFLGVGVTIVGPVNSRQGISLNSLGIFTKPVGIKKYLEKALNIPVCVESNVCAYLGSKFYLKELDSGLNVLAIKWGPGVGSAAFLNNKIYKGNNHESTEIGHCTSISGNEKCRCGKIGCLETLMSVNKLSKILIALSKKPENSDIAQLIKEHGEPSIINITYFLTCGNKEFDDYIDKCCGELAFHISNAFSLIIPDKILLLGELFVLPRISSLIIKNVTSLNNTVSEDCFIIDNSNSEIDCQGGLGIVIEKLLFKKGGA